LKNSLGMNHIVATDFNPLKKDLNLLLSSLGTDYIKYAQTL